MLALVVISVLGVLSLTNAVDVWAATIRSLPRNDVWEMMDQLRTSNANLAQEIVEEDGHAPEALNMATTYMQAVGVGVIGALNPAAGLALSVAFSMFNSATSNNVDVDRLKREILNEVRSLIAESFLLSNLDSAREGFMGVANVMYFNGVSNNTLAFFDNIAPAIFNGRCWSNGSGGLVSCDDWQRGGSVYLSLPFAVAHLSTLFDHAGALAAAGDAAGARALVDRATIQGRWYHHLNTAAFSRFRDTRLINISRVRISMHGRPNQRMCTVMEFPVDTHAGNSYDLRNSTCRNARTSVSTTLSQACRFLEDEWNACIAQYRTNMQNNLNAFGRQVASFPDIYS